MTSLAPGLSLSPGGKAVLLTAVHGLVSLWEYQGLNQTLPFSPKGWLGSLFLAALLPQVTRELAVSTHVALCDSMCQGQSHQSGSSPISPRVYLPLLLNQCLLLPSAFCLYPLLTEVLSVPPSSSTCLAVASSHMTRGIFTCVSYPLHHWREIQILIYTPLMY